jgi:hypothetical protein
VSDERFYWCRKHGRVETSGAACAAQDLLGPYPSAAAARNWKQQHDAREERWEAQDEEWEGE